ncbi:HCP-like protein [Backusella circina FSU 941]|nr:HCP-like protein [Backusella circina FSU 941]
MNVKRYGITLQTKRNHSKYDLYNGLVEDGMEVSDQLLKDAKEGDMDALLKIAYLYDEKVNSYTQKSLGWSLLAAVKECPQAQFKVASMLQLGAPGIKQDYNLAMEWYLQAAENGSVDAMNNIGCMYRNGDGVMQDYTAAKEWFERASTHKVAQFNIAGMFENGLGSSVDKKKAFDWYRKSADQGFQVAGEVLNNIKNSANHLQDLQQTICSISTKINQSQVDINHTMEKISKLELFFKTKIREIEQREDDSRKDTKKRARESDNDSDISDTEGRCKHKKFSYRWIKHLALYQS